MEKSRLMATHFQAVTPAFNYTQLQPRLINRPKAGVQFGLDSKKEDEPEDLNRHAPLSLVKGLVYSLILSLVTIGLIFMPKKQTCVISDKGEPVEEVAKGMELNPKQWNLEELSLQPGDSVVYTGGHTLTQYRDGELVSQIEKNDQKDNKSK